MKILFMMLTPWMVMADTIYFQWDCDDVAQSWFNGWYTTGGDSSLLVSTDPHGGDSCMQLGFKGDDGGNQGLGADVDQIVYGQLTNKALYCRWWMKIDAGFSWGTGSGYTKASRMLDSPNTDQFWTGYLRGKPGAYQGFFLSEINGHLSDACLPEYYDAGGILTPYDIGALAGDGWHEFIVAQKFETDLTSSDGWWKVYVDGSLIDSIGDVNYACTSSNAAVAWGGWMVSPYAQLNGTASDGGRMWIDDIFVSDYYSSLTGGSSLKNIGNMGTIDTISIDTGRTKTYTVISSYSGNLKFYGSSGGALVCSSAVLSNGQTGHMRIPNSTTTVLSVFGVSKP